MAKKKFRIIPIEGTAFTYMADRKGNIFRREGKKRVKVGAWKHQAPKRKGGGLYMRVKFKMTNGDTGFFFVQRLMMCAWRGMPIRSSDVVRHGKLGSLNNELRNLKRGTHYDNQGKDRVEQGTHLARGGNKIEDVKAIEYVHARVAEECFGGSSRLCTDLHNDLPF